LSISAPAIAANTISVTVGGGTLGIDYTPSCASETAAGLEAVSERVLWIVAAPR
jgi:hypothetical protein